tara:strand:- start:187 stop:738 length:552 start_codon:yes stop_codon:yes gene_type:complete
MNNQNINKLIEVREAINLLDKGKINEGLLLLESLYENNRNYHASCYLGILYTSGSEKKNIKEDYTRGLSYLLKGAINHHSDSQFFLGSILEARAKSKHQVKNAYLWLVRAKKNGSEKAENKIKEIEETLDEAYLKEFTYYVEELESIKDEKKYLNQLFSNLNPDDDMYELMKKWKEYFNNKKI